VRSRWLGLKDLVVDGVQSTTAIVERSQQATVDSYLGLLADVEPLEHPAAVLGAAWNLYTAATCGLIRGITGAVGGLIEAGHDLAGPALLEAPEAPTPQRSDAAGSAPWWRDSLQGVLNGLVGDHLREAGNALCLSATFRRAGAELPLDPRGLAAALPAATPRVCVFVHGSCATEWSWSLKAEDAHGDPSQTYGSLLARDLGYTPLYLRFNSGLHISESGAQLSELLDAAIGAWPVPVEDIVLIGHSMGGLVARSACHQAEADGWLEHVRAVISLAAPSLGVPLEKLGNVATWALSQLGSVWARIVVDVANARSAGIKDLRFGYLHEEDWRGHDPDALLQNNRCPHPNLPGVRSYFLGASVTADPSRSGGALVGDGMVRLPSACGEGLEWDGRCVLGGLGHLDLLNHPQVYAQIRAWCDV
jgi:pimeloyl-ACP methyl ester carboxylesterase